jgi:hypothetical protein
MPIPKPLIDLYQLGDTNTALSLDKAQTLLTCTHKSTAASTKDIDNAAKLVINSLTHFHQLAQSIWPMAQTPATPHQTKLHTPITKSEKPFK